ncbi:hypothetical protein CH262_18935 [Rhodococcus sp. 05-2255-1e]|uniref:hypothetical protein n=1 Tax=Rhodococcus sp. 05-2255-1e TaxID=2022495 RepID=UPI000B9BD5EF|nr:hypothetical protein [Rhodococcus sp. 05-2255-1e]OZE22148.1 hypothetical protein CH262_18935 [Rhodococcus sp. 05-2255-1e]
MAPNTIIDPARIVTVRGRELGKYRLGHVRYETEKWGRIIAALDEGRPVLVAPVDGADGFDLAVAEAAEFDVLPVVSDGV